MIGMGLILAVSMEELRFGTINTDEMRKPRMQGSFAMPLHAFTESYSIFSYLKAAHLKLSAEKATYIHFWLS